MNPDPTNRGVLIVDDSLTVRMDLFNALAAAGLQAVACATADEARRALAGGRDRFALIILDVILPDGDGIDLLKEVRSNELHQKTAVMLLSTEAEVRDRIRGLATGADEYVGKPYETSYVIARARELLGQSAEALDAGRPTVVIIDDSATFREELKRLLEDAKYRVLAAASGEEGLRLLSDARAAAVIVDGVLPGIDGATVVRRVRLDGALRHIPCLLLTGSEDIGAELRALDAGADAFVRKDEDVAVILARLAALIRRASGPSGAGSPASLLAPKRVLAVDDSPTYLNTLDDALRQQGYEIVLAHSGEEALELLAVQHVDCILLDLVMPGLGGHETCRRIKAAPGVRDIPLLMLTALEDRQAMVMGLRAGADDYIAKSSDLEVLKARVLAQLRRKQFEDENRHMREQLLEREMEAIESRAARALAEARATLLASLEEKNRELEAFSYSVSHDLRAPARHINGFAAMLLEDYGEKLDEVGRDYLRRMRGASTRMMQLVDDLLELSRIGRIEMRRSEVDLSQLAREIADELTRRDPSRAVEFRIGSGLVAEADAGLVRIVLDNLLGNAFKFSGGASPAVIEVGARDAGGAVDYFVRDNGVGFAMEHAHKLFAPFERLHREDEFPGTGIGLATVRRIVERHGGQIRAEAALGAGATFYFTLGARRGTS